MSLELPSDTYVSALHHNEARTPPAVVGAIIAISALASAGLFLKALAAHSANLPALIRANLGNQLASDANLARMAPLAAKAPELEQDKLEQVAALPLGSRIQLDPWSGQITLVKAKPVSLLSARDKMPFEVTPFMIFLSRSNPHGRETDPAGNNPPVENHKE